MTLEREGRIEVVWKTPGAKIRKGAAKLGCLTKRNKLGLRINVMGVVKLSLAASEISKIFGQKSAF